MRIIKHKLVQSSLLALCLVSGTAFAYGGGGWHGGPGWNGGGGWNSGSGWRGGNGGASWNGGGWNGSGWRGGHGGYWRGGYWGRGVAIGYPAVAPYRCQTVQICDNYTGNCWFQRRCY